MKKTARLLRKPHHDSQPVFKKARIVPPSSSSNAATNNHSISDDQLQGMPSSSSVSDLTNKILSTANEIHQEDVDADVDHLIDYIIDLLEHIKVHCNFSHLSSI